MRVSGWFLALGLLGGAAVLTSAVAAMPSPPAPATAAETYTIDTAHSTVMFRIMHLGVSYSYGRFNEFEGAFTIDDAAAGKSSVKVQIKTESVDTNSEGRDKHLRSPDFFNAVQYPVITFESKRVAKKSDDTFAISGELDLHGVKKEVSFDMKLVGRKDTDRGYRAGLEGHLKLDRTDFGIETYPDALGNEVTITISVEGVRE